jgi:hypothetical protein
MTTGLRLHAEGLSVASRTAAAREEELVAWLAGADELKVGPLLGRVTAVTAGRHHLRY